MDKDEDRITQLEKRVEIIEKRHKDRVDALRTIVKSVDDRRKRTEDLTDATMNIEAELGDK